MHAVKRSPRAVGSHAEVWHGTADHTSGGLTKSDLMKNRYGRIVSIKKHNLGKRAYARNCGKMADPYAPKTACHAMQARRSPRMMAVRSSPRA